MNLSEKDKFNIMVDEKFTNMNAKERYVAIKEARNGAIVSLTVGLFATLLGLILSETTSRLFYGMIIVGLLGLVNGTIGVINPKRAILTSIGNAIREQDTDVHDRLLSEGKKKQKRFAMIWFVFLGVFVLIIVGMLVAMVLSSK